MTSDGRQWVVNAMNGEVMERKNATYFVDKQKNILWIPKNYELSPLDVPQFYSWKNPKNATI